MDFALFVALNAVLLIRPDDLFPELAGLRMYLMVIVLCLLAAGPRLLHTVRLSSPAGRPVTVCVLLFAAAAFLSQAARGQVGVAFGFIGEFGKTVVYFLLLVSVVDTPGRLRAFLGWMVWLTTVLAGLGLAQYYGAIDVPALRSLEDRMWVDPETGEAVLLNQLRSMGMFHDPNDFCLILVFAAVAAGYRAVTAGSVVGALPWLAPAGLFVASIGLTHSRGGLLGLLVAGVAYLTARFGWKRAIPLGLAALPVVAVLFAGRATDMGGEGGGTANQRLQFWSEGFVLLSTAAAGPQTPLTGVGTGRFAEFVGHVAHNSFVHAFVETGLLGGTFFAGAFALAALGVYMTPPAGPGADPRGVAALRPWVFAQVVGFAGGIFSLSRCYIVPTVMPLGVATAYLALAWPWPPDWFRVDRKGAVRLAAFGLFVFLFLRTFTQVFVRY